MNTATAFAPSAITNFFAINYDSSPEPTGATGGGYILSKGTFTKATFDRDHDHSLSISVNGDEGYGARTTGRAIELLLSSNGVKPGALRLEQTVEVPIGGGFGASGASATSAVYAAAAAAGLEGTSSELARYAHRAEIMEQTGVGTVSVVYQATGAGAITVPGEPGAARFVNVEVPKGLCLVTAFIGPYDKKDALSSDRMVRRINTLGGKALQTFLSNPTIETLAREGEVFSEALGLQTVEISKLITLAKSAGALFASQNMIGYSIHSLVDSQGSERVAQTLRGYSNDVRVDEFQVGTKRAGLV